jgi:putative transferase (TIGR04331 family)
MTKVARYLITTADERTWKFDRPVIFLGEWCRLYNRKHIWQDMDAIVAAPYGLGLAKKDADYAEARALEDRLFPKLCEVLNQHHGTQHGERFWRIVLGHWFRRIISLSLNRINTIKQCLNEYDISDCAAYDTDHYDLATIDSYSAIWAFNDDQWNLALNSKLLNLLGKSGGEYKSKKKDEVYKISKFNFKNNIIQQSKKEKIYKYFLNVAKKIINLCSKDSDAVIVNSYLPRKFTIRLEIALKQCPQLWTPPKFKTLKMPDQHIRKKLCMHLKGECNNDLEHIISNLIFESMPVCYIEGYLELNSASNKFHWPKQPKFILTSNNFDTDEIFKIWTAEKIEEGVKYYVGQHGNNYGTSRYMYPSIEELTSDKFLTWGWSDGLPQHEPVFNFKTVNKNQKKYNSKGGLLLIEACLNQRFNIWDDYFEFGSYFNNQIEFVKELGLTPKQKLVIRLHAAFRYFSWFEDLRWHDFDPELKIDTGESDIHKLLEDSRLVVHSYDSTGILETLSLNIPTLAFWENGLDHLRESAMPYYQLLVDAGIIHFSAASVAHKVNEIWGDVDAWWTQEVVQDARSKFCNRYARTNNNPMRSIKKILID